MGGVAGSRRGARPQAQAQSADAQGPRSLSQDPRRLLAAPAGDRRPTPPACARAPIPSAGTLRLRRSLLADALSAGREWDGARRIPTLLHARLLEADRLLPVALQGTDLCGLFADPLSPG